VVQRAVRDWQQGVLDMVRTEGAERRTTARVLAYGVNSLGVALMIVIFAQTGGLIGAEVGVAGGTAVVGQKILEAVFGDQAVRRLAEQARLDLQKRVDDLLHSEYARFLEVLDAFPVDPSMPDQLRRLAREVEDARIASDVS